MLTRQWQLGEFEGEDSGSPIYVNVVNRQDEISGVLQNRDVFEYDGSMPLEVFVERTSPEVTTSKANGGTDSQLDLQMQVRLGLQFHSEVDVLLKDILVDTAEIRRFKRFLAQDPELRFELNQKQTEFEVEVTKKFISIVKWRVINIYKATGNLNSAEILMRKIDEYFEENPNPDHSVPAAVKKAVLHAIENLKIWWYGKKEQPHAVNREPAFFEGLPENLSTWNSRRLEYDFKVQITPKDLAGNLTGKLILDASGYKEDHLDWYSFTVSNESTEDLELTSKKQAQNQPWPPYPIATRFKFAGMPEKRWWNFEDTHVDFGSISPKMNNIASILLMEFALVYSPDWFVIPCRMSVGSVNKIDKLAVLDCFGDETLIEPAGNTESELHMKQSDKSWDSWGMFTLSEKYKDRDKQHFTPYFFLPPALDYVLTGLPLEEVRMLRDETANLVWAVERTYRTFYGEPVSGYDHSVLLQKRTTDVLLLDEDDGGEESDKPLKYKLMTGVPRNWIPFIPVHTTNLTSGPVDPIQKQIELQRASMINAADQSCIRPNSRLLNEVQSPYYIDEVEVPRDGISVSESCQMTVWHSGDNFLWIGRKKLYGAHEGSSGLLFDTVSENG